MIHESVSRIRDVEQEVAAAMADATEEAKKIIASAERDAEQTRSKTVAQSKEERRIVADLAREDAEKEYKKILSSGERNAERLRETTDVAPAVEFIKEKVLANYVDR